MHQPYTILLHNVRNMTSKVSRILLHYFAGRMVSNNLSTTTLDTDPPPSSQQLHVPFGVGSWPLRRQHPSVLVELLLMARFMVLSSEGSKQHLLRIGHDISPEQLQAHVTYSDFRLYNTNIATTQSFIRPWHLIYSFSYLYDFLYCHHCRKLGSYLPYFYLTFGPCIVLIVTTCQFCFLMIQHHMFP